MRVRRSVNGPKAVRMERIRLSEGLWFEQMVQCEVEEMEKIEESS